MRRTVVIVAAAVLALFAGVKFVPWLTTKQDVLLSSPTSPPLFSGQTEVPLAPEQELCVNPVDLAPGYHTAHLLVSGPARLALTITAPGYSATARASGKGGPVVVVPLPKLPRSAQGVACMRNEGSQPFQLEGNVEARTQSRPATLLDGRRIQGDVPLSFWRGRSQSRAAALLDAIPRMSVFKPLGERFFWLLLALVVLAVPALVITALVSGLRED
ncbi:MAG TPA: hypothetical protein VN606_00025 [Thermoleophilaceae bacterium]|jgi:hypothetical protein|nr:hypothetical protein [Thermoleophilaceae bacterium]